MAQRQPKKSKNAASGFDDTDFRPQVARKTFGGSKQEAAVSGGTKRKRLEVPGSAPAASGELNARLKADEVVKGRKWNAGAGERPGSKSKAEGLLEAEAAAFERDMGKRAASDQRWLQQVRVSGTVADKLAALTLLIQESAVANLKALDELMRWATKHSGARGVAGEAIDALAEVFVVALLPDRRLTAFADQPLSALSPDASDKVAQRQLLYFRLEDCIKTRYAAFVGVLELASRDNLDFIKDKAIRALGRLLAAKPEQEARILAALVNKLGDPSRKLASKAAFLMSEVLHQHPRMGVHVAREVERFLFRPGLAPRARYTALVFLNQIQLSHNPDFGGSSLAEKLIDIYFAVFNTLMSAAISANDADPDGDSAPVHSGSAQHSTAKQQHRVGKKGRHKPRAKGREQAKNGASNDKAHDSGQTNKEVDARLLGALLVGVRRAFPYVDTSVSETLIDKHSGSLFRISHTAPLGVGLQSLALLFQLLTAQSAASDRFYRALYALLLAPEASSSSRAPLLCSLVFRAAAADPKTARVAAFAKRLLQLALAHPPNFACACLLLLSQLLQEKPALWRAVKKPEEASGDDLEHFRDAPDPDSDGPDDSSPAMTHPALATAKPAQAAGAAAGDGGAAAGLKEDAKSEGYDMRKREPAYCGADMSAWWELGLLSQHWHPSVAAFARALLSGEHVSYNGDPLRDLTLPAFLDKFVQRKPKAGKTKGRSVMQPMRGESSGGTAPSAAAIGSAAFAAMAQKEVPADNLIFHKFYTLASKSAAQGRTAKRAKRKQGGDDSDDDADDDSDVSEDAADVDEFLAAEEDLGDEGGGADPNAGFDYSMLAQALQSDDKADSLVGDDDSAPADANADSVDDSSDDDAEAGLRAFDVVDDDDDSAEDASADESDGDDVMDRALGDTSAEDESAEDDDESLEIEDDLIQGAEDDINPFELASGSDDSAGAPLDGYASSGPLEDDVKPADSDTDSTRGKGQRSKR
ncbi:hypothetical protein WJX73_009608 [Symbiochloris irregularis]|uniref:CCAAT-binding factor domain-containing protein n=1 Tax=Symbiochloris irregularis TaxID=706552 RepID=A0AAW1PN86_9CHLO